VKQDFEKMLLIIYPQPSDSSMC